MWECQKCHERLEDSFEVCWNCGTSKAGVEDPGFRPADEMDPASLEQAARLPVEEIASATAAAHRTAPYRAGHNAYEFNPEQNEVIASLASNMKIVGVASVIAGTLLVVARFVLFAKGGISALIEGVLASVIGVLALVIGAFTVQAAAAFRRIVDSHGDDISHLMTALAVLRSLYRLQVILLCIALGLLAVAFCLVVVATA